MMSAARARLPIRQSDERLVVLRLSDITERVWGLYLALETGCISNYPEGPDTIIENLRELQPTILGADAEVWAHLQALAAARVKAATATQRLVYQWALRAGRAGGSTGRLADLLVLRAVRREFGLNRLRLAYVGGTAVGSAAMDWALSLGIAIQRVDDVVLRVRPSRRALSGLAAERLRVSFVQIEGPLIASPGTTTTLSWQVDASIGKVSATQLILPVQSAAVQSAGTILKCNSPGGSRHTDCDRPPLVYRDRSGIGFEP